MTLPSNYVLQLISIAIAHRVPFWKIPFRSPHGVRNGRAGRLPDARAEWALWLRQRGHTLTFIAETIGWKDHSAAQIAISKLERKLESQISYTPK